MKSPMLTAFSEFRTAQLLLSVQLFNCIYASLYIMRPTLLFLHLPPPPFPPPRMLFAQRTLVVLVTVVWVTCLKPYTSCSTLRLCVLSSLVFLRNKIVRCTPNRIVIFSK